MTGIKEIGTEWTSKMHHHYFCYEQICFINSESFFGAIIMNAHELCSLSIYAANSQYYKCNIAS